MDIVINFTETSFEGENTKLEYLAYSAVSSPVSGLFFSCRVTEPQVFSCVLEMQN